MDLAKESLRKLDSELGGHLSGDAVDVLLKTFEIRFAAALPAGAAWPERIAAAGAGGATHLILPVSASAEPGGAGLDSGRAGELRRAFEGEGLNLAAIDLDFPSFPRFRRGALTHSDSAVRRAALSLALESVSLAKEEGAAYLRLSSDTDGSDCAFQVNYGASLQHFLDACDEINASARSAGVALSIAPARRGSRAQGTVIPDVQRAAFVAERVNRDGGGKNAGVSADCGSEPGALSPAAEAMYFARVAGVPVHEIGLGAPPVPAALDSLRFCDALYAAIDTGFEGPFRADADPAEDATARSIATARELFANALRRALLVYRDKDVLLRAQAMGDAATVVAALSRAASSGLPIRVAPPLKAPAKKRAAKAGK